MRKQPKKDSLEKKIEKASKLAIEHDERSLLESIQELNSLLLLPRISNENKINILINLANAYQNRGQHQLAIDTLDKLQNAEVENSHQLNILIKQKYAISFAALGDFNGACKLFDQAIDEIDKLKDINSLMIAALYLEAGKAYSQNKQIKKAEKYWGKACSIYEKDPNEIGHLGRAKSNLGSILLKSRIKEEQLSGVQLIEESSDIKRRVGDLDGLASNYCNLSLYYWKINRYERAIAFARKDLFFSRKVGNLRGIGSTLGNLAGIYAELKQLSPARECLREGIEIGNKLNDSRLVAICQHNLDRVNAIGKEAGARGETIGPEAPCACKSGNQYKDCCGKADFEPIDIPFEFGKVSEEIAPIHNKITNAGGVPSRLDFIFRDTKQSRGRLAWVQHQTHDGWFEMHELPDMANHHLIAANSLLAELKDKGEADVAIHKPLACLLLSACALEAFINQVAFFLNDIKKYPEKEFHIIPTELSIDPWEFQRGTELTKKWDILGQSLCKTGWPPPQDLWNEFKTLISLRNELIHFKVNEYEQVVPKQKKHSILDKVPKRVQIRDIPHAWPSRLLTASFASWSVETTCNLIDYFKKHYMETRISSCNKS